ncbi:MAG: DNA-binding protein [Nitrosopumilaceae archaeon]
MSSEDKPTDAEEIISEFQKKEAEQEKPAPEPSLAAPEPEIQLPHQEKELPPPEKELPLPEKELPPPEPSKTTESDSPKDDDEDRSHVRNVIYVGLKPIMTYVTATLTQLSSQPTVTIKARGKRITQAVDVSQMIVKRMDFVGYNVSDVRIASDSLKSQDGRMRNVSTIEIDVSKT